MAALLAACGDSEPSPSHPDAGPGNPDGGPLPDCDMRISLAPPMPSVPTDLVATAEIVSESLFGVQTFAWDVRFDDELVEPVLSPDGRQITFAATEPGTYEVRLSGSVDYYTCNGAQEFVTVAPADATTISYRVRFVPGPGQPAVIHERTDTMVAGLDYDLGRITLPSGIPVSGSVHGPGGEPLAAYLRATRSDAVPVETFAGADGVFSMRLAGPSVDVLVVPVDPAHAPARFPAQPITAPWTLTLPAAASARGTLRDAGGQGLARARIALRIDGAPAAVAVTDDQGAFALPARAGSAAELLVIPADTGLPWLELGPSSELAAALAGGGDLAIAYTAGLASHEVAPTAFDAGGTPLGGVSATWIATSVTAPGGSAAGTVTVGDGDPVVLPLAGSARVTVIAGPDGAWLPVRLPSAAYDVVLEPAGDSAGSVTVRSVDLTTDPDVAFLDLAQPALVRGRVVDSDGNGLGSVQVTASPRGQLAHSAAAGATAGAAEDGAFELSLAPDTEYELVIAGAARGRGRARITVTTPVAGQGLDLAPTPLPEASSLRGEVALLDGAGGAAGVTVLLSCLDCDDPAPLAEAVTDSTGAFVLAVPYEPDAP
jgi:hypothetical protein